MSLRALWSRWFGRRATTQDTLAIRLDSAVRGSRERDLLRGAEESFRRGRTAEGLRAYQAVLRVYRDRGAHAKAVSVLSQLCRLDPENPAHFESLAEVQEQLGRRQEAGQARQQAATLHQRRGADTRAAQLRMPQPSRDGPDGLVVHRRRSTSVVLSREVHEAAGSGPLLAPSPAPDPADHEPIDLGPLDPSVAMPGVKAPAAPDPNESLDPTLRDSACDDVLASDAGDQTIWDPRFVAVHRDEPESLETSGGSGKAGSSGPRPSIANDATALERLPTTRSRQARPRSPAPFEETES